MTLHTDRTASPLARVIPLERNSRVGAHRVAHAPAARDRAELAHALDLLERRCGPSFARLPAALGRMALRAEALLATGPTAIDPATSARAAVHRAEPLVHLAAVLADLVSEEAAVLAAALRADLADLPLDELEEIAEAILDLVHATCVEPAWATPAAADAAAMVLSTVESQLRPVARLHDELYADFTDHVLEIQEPLLRAGGQPWRVVARAMLRHRLAAASRTGRVPGSLRAVSRRVLAVREARAELATLGPLLSTHLGGGEWRPLTDVDAVMASLTAVRRCQSALGDRLETDQLASLLAARAFQSTDLVHPATTLHLALVRWRLDVTERGGADPWVLSAPELARWAAATGSALPAISSGAAAMTEIGRPLTTLGVLVDDLLLSERAAELAPRLSGSDQEDGRTDVAPGGAS